MLLLGRINSDGKDSAQKQLRDKAFINLNELVHIVQRYGKYVFRSNPDKLKDYQRKYY